MKQTIHHNKRLKKIVKFTEIAMIAIAFPATSFALAPNEYQRNDWILDGSDSAAWGGATDFTNSQITNGARLEIGVGCNGSGSFCANVDYDSDGWFYATSTDAIVEGKGTSGNQATLFVAGESFGTSVRNGGQEIVAKGTYVAFPSEPDEQIPWELYPAKATGTTVSSGGLQRVYGGGTSVDTLVESGGLQYVYRDGNGIKAADEAGTSIGTKVMAGGTQYVYLNEARSIGTILDGGKQHVYGNASATGTIIKDGGIQYIRSNPTDDAGTAIDTKIETGGIQYVYLDDSKSINAEINGGKQNVYGNASAVGTTINAGGVQSIYEASSGAGYAEDTVVNTGGKQQLLKGASAKNTTVNGGLTVIDAGANHSGFLNVNSGGVLAVTSNNIISNIENISLKGGDSILYISENADNNGSQSYLNVKNLENSGVVQFTSAKNNDANPIDSFTPVILNVNKLSGNGGIYAMHADIGVARGDLLKVNQLDSSAKGKLFIANNGSSNAQKTDILTVVETNSGGTENQFALANKVEQGGYEFGLRQEGNNWILCADANCTNVVNEGDSGSVNEGSSGDLSSTAQAAGNFLNVGYLLNYVDTQTLMQRMGDIRNTTNQADVDVWARVFTGKLDSFSGQQLSGFDMDYTGTQIGADKRFNLNNSTVYVGGVFGYINADHNYKNGNGSATNYSLGLYSSYVNDRNFYIDGLFRYNNIKSEFDVKDTQQNTVSGKTQTNGYSLSVELGKRFYMYDIAKGSIYVEPQTQLSYAYQNGDRVNASNGLQVHSNSYESVLGRISTVVGYEVKNTENPINVYFKTGYVREFAGDDIKYFLNNSQEKYSFRGNFWDNEIGISARIRKQHTIHADVGYAAGDRFNKTQFNIGYRFEF